MRERLEGIATAAEVPFASLPVQVITAPSLRLDTPTDRERLSQTVQQQRPVFLILDPLIRLHRVDENDATQIAALLSFLVPYWKNPVQEAQHFSKFTRWRWPTPGRSGAPSV